MNALRRNRQRSPRRPSTRAALLATLRAQWCRIGAASFSAQEAPELYALAMAASRARRGRKSIVFRGVRFPLAFGSFRRYVLDPDTRQTLVGGPFLQ